MENSTTTLQCFHINYAHLINSYLFILAGDYEPQRHHDGCYPQFPPPVPAVHTVQFRYAWSCMSQWFSQFLQFFTSFQEYIVIVWMACCFWENILNLYYLFIWFLKMCSKGHSMCHISVTFGHVHRFSGFKWDFCSQQHSAYFEVERFFLDSNFGHILWPFCLLYKNFKYFSRFLSNHTRFFCCYLRFQNVYFDSLCDIPITEETNNAPSPVIHCDFHQFCTNL